MSQDDTRYYLKRAEEERALARAAQRKDVASVHERMATEYQAKADQGQASAA